jgi:hypothetical protein
MSGITALPLSREYYQERIQWSKRQVNITTGEKVAAWIDGRGASIICSCDIEARPLQGLAIADRPRSVGFKRAIDSGWREKLAFVQQILNTTPAVLQAQAKTVREKNLLSGNLYGMNARFIKSLKRHELRDADILLAVRKELGLPDSATENEVQLTALHLLCNQSAEASGKTWKHILQAINRGIAYHFLSEHFDRFRPIELCAAVRLDLDADAPQSLLLDLLKYKLLRGGPDADLLVGEMLKQVPDMQPLMATLIDLPHLRTILSEESPRTDRTMLDPLLIKSTLDLGSQRLIYDPVYNEIRVVTPSMFSQYCSQKGFSEKEMIQEVLLAYTRLIKDPAALEGEVPGFVQTAYFLQNLLLLLEKLPPSEQTPDLVRALSSRVLHLAREKVESIATGSPFSITEAKLFRTLMMTLSRDLQTLNQTQLHLPETDLPLIGQAEEICDRMINCKLDLLFSGMIFGLRRYIELSLPPQASHDEYRELCRTFLSSSSEEIDKVMFRQTDREFQSMIDSYLEKEGTRTAKIEAYRARAFAEVSAALQAWENKKAAEVALTQTTALQHGIDTEPAKAAVVPKKIGILCDFKHLRSSVEHMRTVLRIVEEDRENEAMRSFKQPQVEQIYKALLALYEGLMEGIETTDGPQLFKVLEQIESMKAFVEALQIEPRDREAVLRAFDALPETVRNWIYYAIWDAKGRPNIWGYGESQLRRDPFMVLGFINREGKNLLEQIIEKEIDTVWNQFARNLAEKQALVKDQIHLLIEHGVKNTFEVTSQPAYQEDLKRMGLNPITQDPLGIAFQIATSRITMPLESLIQAMGKDRRAYGLDPKMDPLYQGLLGTYRELKSLIFKANLNV